MATSGLCHSLLLSTGQAPYVLQWGILFFLELAVLKCRLQTATTTSWHLPAVLSNLIVFIVFHFYADNMHLRYMLFSGGLYSGIKLMELVFKVVMFPIIASYLVFLNNTAKCRNPVLIRRRVSYICSQPSGHGGKEPAGCASTSLTSLGFENQGAQKFGISTAVVECINSQAQWWLVFSGYGSHLSKSLWLRATRCRLCLLKN